MTAIDEFASSLLDEAKRFLEKAAVRDAGETAYLHAALMLGFCSLEAHTNAISDDFSKGGDLSITDQSISRLPTILSREIMVQTRNIRLF